VDTDPSPLYGGIELVVDQMARGLVAAGHDVTLFTTGDSTCPVPKRWALEHAEGMRIGMAVPELRHVIHAYGAVADHDVVHDHTVMGPFYSERFLGLPVVTTIHGPFNDELTDLYSALGTRVPSSPSPTHSSGPRRTSHQKGHPSRARRLGLSLRRRRGRR